MMLGNLRSMSREARNRHDDIEVADLLDQVADRRAAELRASLGGPGWLSAADVPEGVVFVAASRPKGIRYRREGPKCWSLPPYGSGRLVSPAVIDAAHEADGAGYVEPRP